MAVTKVNQYEAMFLFGGSSAGDLDQARNLCKQFIERHGGEILVLKKWDDRKLAYEIKGQKRGVFIIAFFKAPAQAVSALERDVGLNDQILRLLVLRADHLNQQEMEAVEPQPIVAREERPGSGARRDDVRSELPGADDEPGQTDEE